MAFVYQSKRDFNFSSNENITLGPGAYMGHQDLRFQKSEIPFQTTSTRDKSSKVPQIPGPGAYNSSNPKLKVDQFGRYRCSSSFASHKDRFGKVSNELNPGPGSYNLKSSWNYSKRSLSTKSSAKVLRNYPSVPSIPSQSQAFGYDETESGDLIIQKNPVQVHSGLGPDSIGPGHYNPKPVSEIYGGKGVVWHKSASKREDNAKSGNNLGPGSYSDMKANSWYKLKSSPAFASTCKRESYIPLDDESDLSYEKDGNPGPGKYFISNGNEVKAEKEFQRFGSGTKRFKDEKSQVPGPGYYKAREGKQVSASKAPFASTDMRFTHKANKIPGPGTYCEPNFIENMNKKVQSKKAEAFGCSEKRFADKNGKIVPGPGEYEINPQIGIHNSAKQKPSAVFESAVDRSKPGYIQEGPAPGSYSVPSAFQLNKDKKVGGFAKWEKHKINLDEIPQIEPNSAKTLQRVNTEDKMIEKYVNLEGFDKIGTSDGVPGPGAYFKKSVKFGVEREKTSIVSKVNRFQKKDNHNPGPGNYQDPNNWWSKKTFNIKFTDFK